MTGASRWDADVLVLGGGPAGTWAALHAARGGARVVLADKGYCGTSGAAAASNNNVWYVRDPKLQEAEFGARFASGGGLSEPGWTAALLESAVEQLHFLGTLGYPFPKTETGDVNYATLRGPDYMRFMRLQIKRAGVQILDHSPMLGLLERDGCVTGAHGVSRDGTRWQVNAFATVLATGGCAFMSGALGTNVCTGDGHLAAGEVGARFSGMEFSNQYGLAASQSSVTKGLPFVWSTYTRGDGTVVPIVDDEPFVSVARVLVDEPVFAVFDRANADIQRWLRSGQANAFLPFDRAGIDPFTQRFPVGLRLEGTVRGTGGIRLRGRDCATDVPGLYAAGDAASRETVVGGRTGGGSPNSAWAIVTGSWAGTAASEFARRQGTRRAGTLAREEEIALSPVGPSRELIGQHVLSLRTNLFRSAAVLTPALKLLDDAWHETNVEVGTPHLAEARSARAMLYVARLAYRSALHRRESRALHQRGDYPERSDAMRHRLVVAGIDSFEFSTDPVAT
ncbi:L-aspartate oxidase [Caballeronia sordidicola]|uniref:L-aspartate oxidase n=1 Tax=Caballeronia sordidicola TaxID=196367 RepID=A0A158HEA6_CABSO|nr:FAD-binding protein [Caballeronia sordidicola]SAL42666.1 L-aspartate oxidase [Caballeronia sordidicola]